MRAPGAKALGIPSIFGLNDMIILTMWSFNLNQGYLRFELEVLLLNDSPPFNHKSKDCSAFGMIPESSGI